MPTFPLTNNSLRHPRVKGFTLIELLITLAVISIITAITLPAYTNSVQKSRRIMAKSALQELATRQEKFYAANNRYANSPTELGYAVSNGDKVDISNENNRVFYQMSMNITNATELAPASFSAKAEPKDAQSDDACGTFTLNSDGERGTTTSKVGCW